MRSGCTKRSAGRRASRWPRARTWAIQSVEGKLRSQMTSISGSMERSSPWARCCSETWQGAKTASTTQWVPTSGRLEAAHLRKGTAAFALGEATEMRGIGRAVGHLIQRAIQRHQPQPKLKGAGGLRRGQWHTALPKQLAQHRDAQLLAAIDQGGSGRQRLGQLRPEPAQPLHQLLQHRPQVQVPPQRKADDVIDHQQLTEFALALFPALTAREPLDDALARVDLLQYGQVQHVRELAFGRDLL